MLRTDHQISITDDTKYHEMQEEFNALCSRLEAAGAVLVRFELPDAQKLTDQGLYPILFYETYPSIVKFLSEWGDGTSIEELHANLGPDIKAMWDQLVLNVADVFFIRIGFPGFS